MANIIGTAGDDEIRPNFVSAGVTGVVQPDLSGNDSIAALGGDDTVVAGDGDDTVDGGGGADRLSGSGGDDLIRARSGSETIIGGGGTDTADYRSFGVTDLSGASLSAVEQVNLANGETKVGAGAIGVAAFFTAFNAGYSLRGAEAGLYDLGDSTFNAAGFVGFFGSSGDDTVRGNDAANDTLSGGDGADLVEGLGGDDLFRPVAGEAVAGDTLDGGAGFDTADFRSGGITDVSGVTLTGIEQVFLSNGLTLVGTGTVGTAAFFTAFNAGYSLRGAEAGLYDLGDSTFNALGFAGFFGSAGDDTVRGNDAAADTLSGGDGADLVEGLGGDDLFRPVAAEQVGGDTLDGGAGFDTADFRSPDVTDLSGLRFIAVEQANLANGTTLIDPGVLGNTIFFTAFNAGYALAGTVEGLYRIGATTFNPGGFAGVFGSAGDDTLIGEAAGDRLGGAEGDDSVIGAGGDDSLTGAAGADTLIGGAGNDTLDGGADLDTAIIIGAAARFTVATAGAVTTVTNTRTGEIDRLTNVETILFSRFVELAGTAGDDLLRGTTEPDRIEGGSGDDTLEGADGGDRLLGGAGEDSLSGGAAADRLDGGGGADALDGGLGQDELDGGSGRDTLTGGSGADAFVFRPGGGDDLVTDFRDGTDRLVFLDFGTGFDEAAEVLAAAVQQGNDVLIAMPDGGSVTIERLVLAELDATDLAFAL